MQLWLKEAHLRGNRYDSSQTAWSLTPAALVEVEVHDGWTVTHQDSTTEIKGEGDHVEKHESQWPFGSRQFWHGIRVALDADGIIGCCPLMAPSSFAYAMWTGTSADWGSADRSSRLIYSLLDTTPELQRSLSHRL
jgi:hypothetical protein